MRFLEIKSDFTKNVVTLLTGTTIAQAIPIAIMPILTRLYTPEEFGVLSLFVAIILVLGTIANARYELAIALPDSDDQAIDVAALAFLISTGFSIVLFIPFTLYGTEISNLLGNESILVWMKFIPLVVFFIGLFNVLNYVNIRYKKFKDIAKAQIYKSVFMVIIQLTFGVIKFGAAGLILGQIASSVGSVYRLSRNIDMKSLFFKLFQLRSILTASVRYRNFPIFMLPASIMNTLSGNLFSLVIPTLFSIKTLGFYTLAQRALGAPVSLIGSSIAQVYIQEAAQERKETGVIVNSFQKTAFKLLILSMCVFIPAYFVIEEMFAIVFGEEWRVAGYYAQVLLPYFALNFIVSSLSMTDSIMERQHFYALFNFFNLVCVIVLVKFFSNEFEGFIRAFTWMFSINYGIYLLVCWFVSKGDFSFNRRRKI